MTRSTRKTPWEKPDPKPPAKREHLTPTQKSKAAARARRAGRPYPNLVDNMAVARTAAKTSGSSRRGRKGATGTNATRKTTTRKTAARKTAARKSAHRKDATRQRSTRKRT